MRLYCLSDLHLHDTRQRFLFTDEKEATFVRVANEARDAGATMLFAGDVLDLTGMQPPEKGLAEFFAALVPNAKIDLPERRSLSARIRAVAARFPDFFAAIAPLAEQGRLVFLPGNHDHGLDSDEGKGALAAAMNVSVDRLRFTETLRAGGFFFGAHGHEFDPSNETLDGGDNPGSVITSTLYHAIVPALQALGLDQDVAEAIPCVRPEENIVAGLQGRIDDQTLHRLLLGFVKLLLENGYFTGPLERVKITIATELLTGFLTADKVRKALADDTDVVGQVRVAAQEILKGGVLAFAPGPPPDAVVLGHTHEIDMLDDYVNLGTWIDHVRGIGDDDLKKADRRLPVLVLDEEKRWARLHDVAPLASVSSVSACPILWRFGIEL